MSAKTSLNSTSATKMAPTAVKSSLAADKNNKIWLLRTKQYKSFQELSKSIRMTFLEKRYALDPVEKANLQKSLDSMQHCIKVKTRQGLIERLESLSRQLGLKFMEDTGLFISSDMFYLEIILDKIGTVQDVKVHHEGNIEQQSCNELVTCLQKGDFTDFTAQLEGLQSIYQLNAEPKIKSKAFVALQALETDLYNLSLLQAYIKDPQILLMQSPVGILQKRRGGHPMRCTFLVSPYELIDSEKKQMQTLSVELINAKKLGTSVTVNLEAAAANKLQTMPVLSISKDQQGRSSPTYLPIGVSNSTMLPASFILRLDKPMPMSMVLVQQLKQLQTESSTFLTTASAQPPASLINLIVKNATNNEIESMTKGLFISLPDQCHYYFMTENKALQGIVIAGVPFTEPSHVPQIIKLLRQQALFNTLISSCIRLNGKQDIENMILFEINAISEQYISVSLENPYEESIETVEFDLADCCNIVCKLFSNTKSTDTTIAAHLSRCVQKSFSIPITLRALLKFWERESIKTRQQYDGFGGRDPGGGGGGGRIASGSDAKFIKTERNGAVGSNGFGSNGSAGGNRLFHQGNGDGGPNANGLGFNESLFTGSGATGDTGNPNSETNFLNQLQNEMQMSISGSGSDAVQQKPIKRRRLTGEDFWKSPKSLKTDDNMSECDDSNISLGSDSNSSLGVKKSATEKSVGVSGTTAMSEYQLFLENKMKKSPANEDEEDDVEMLDFETGEIFRQQQKKSMKDAAEKMPNVSITPINSVLSGMGLERRPGIEIIPITSTSQNLPSSITITPINASSSSSSSSPSSSSKKSSSSSSKKHDDRNRLEKKKKRKRDDSPSMGPPEKIPSKQDPLTKPVSLSINPLSPAAAGLIRKYSTSSPTSLSTSPKLQSSSSSSSIRSSPKHSPVHPASNSPKHHGISSPKHPGSGGGKPSVTTLKSLNSPKSSEKSSSSSSRDKDRDREKKSSSSGSSSPKISKSSSSSKTKQCDQSQMDLVQLLSGGDEKSVSLSGNASISAIGSASGGGNNNNNNQNRNRKGLLSAVIDKLSKSAQNTTDDSSNSSTSSSPTPPITSSNMLNFKSGQSLNLSINNNNNTNPGGNKNPEYMVKHSSDGMKITINKTIRAKESGSSKSLPKSSSFSMSSQSGSSSPKASHTGLKPGVSSGPASKKSQSSSSTKSSSSSTSSKLLFQKSSSSGSLGSSSSFSKQSSGSSKSSSSSSKDKQKSSSKSHFIPSNDVMKMLGFPTSSSQAMEGFMKSFDTKFQIPKLSARTNEEVVKKEKTVTPSASSTSAPTTPTAVMTSPGGGNGATSDAKMMFADFLDTNQQQQQSTAKYQFPFSTAKMPGDVSPMHFATPTPPTMGMPPSSSPKYNSTNSIYHTQLQDLPFAVKERSTTPQHTPPRPPPIESPKFYNKDENSLDMLQQMRPPSMSPSNLSNHSNSNSCGGFSEQIAEALHQQQTMNHIKSDGTFLKNSSTTPPIPQPPVVSKPQAVPAASVSAFVIKSPVPSPISMIIPSPHSNSSADDLLDGQMEGIGGK